MEEEQNPQTEKYEERITYMSSWRDAIAIEKFICI